MKLSIVILAGALAVLPNPLLAQEATPTRQVRASGAPAVPAAVAPVAAPAIGAAPALTSEQIESFLLNATIVNSRKIGKGVTDSRVATLSDGHLTHDAHIQHVNVERSVDAVFFKDQFRYNIAAYRIARLLGLTNVPVSVERKVDDTPAAVTWWVDGVMMDEGERLEREKKKTAPQGWTRIRTVNYLHVMRVFDELIANTDRNNGNQLWTNDGTLWLIDHTRAFRLQRGLKKPEKLERCDRALWKALQALTLESVTAAVEHTLSKDEISALLARRDRIVKRFASMIESHGEASTLFSLTP